MSSDQDMVFLFRPVVETLFRFVLAGIVFGGAGRVKNSEPLQRLPEIADQEAGETP